MDFSKLSMGILHRNPTGIFLSSSSDEPPRISAKNLAWGLPESRFRQKFMRGGPGALYKGLHTVYNNMQFADCGQIYGLEALPAWRTM